MKINKKYLGLAGLLILAAILRLLAIAKYGAFYWDELFSFHYSQLPWLESLKLWTWETNPPLHMFVLKLWWYIFPTTEFWARVPSWLFGVASVYALYNFAQRIFDKKIAIIAAAFLALSPYHIFISATARGYSLLILLTILAVDYFHRIFIANANSRKNQIIFALTHLLLMLTHLTGALVILGEIIILFSLNRRKIINWVQLGIIPLLLWLIWAVPSLLAKANMDTAGKSWFFFIDNDWLNAIFSIQSLFFGLVSIPARKISAAFPFAFIWVVLGLIIIALISSLIYCFYRQNKAGVINQNLAFVSIFWGWPIFIAIVLRLWQVKFFTVSLPFLILIIAYLLNYYLREKILTTVAVVALNIFGLIMLARALPINDWGEINNYLQSHLDPNKKQILIYNHFVDKLSLERYLKVNVATLPYLGPDDQNQNWDNLLVKKNYYRYIHSDTEMIKWYRDKRLTDYDEIFLFKEIGVGLDIDWTLITNRWNFLGGIIGRLGDTRTITLYGHPTGTTSTIQKN